MFDRSVFKHNYAAINLLFGKTWFIFIMTTLICKYIIKFCIWASIRLREKAVRSSVLGWGDRRERLQLRLLPGEIHRIHEDLRATSCEKHNGRCKGKYSDHHWVFIIQWVISYLREIKKEGGVWLTIWLVCWANCLTHQSHVIWLLSIQ